MKRLLRSMVTGLCGVAVISPLAIAQKTPPKPPPSVQTHNAPVTTVTVDGNEAMFATMCALYAAGFEANVSSGNWRPLRAQLRERLRNQQGPAVVALRDYYNQHQLEDAGATLSEYIWYALIAGPAPKFEPMLARDFLPPEVVALDGFSDILSAYYREQNIGALWRQVQPIYNHDIEELHDSIASIVFLATNYLRELPDPANPRTFTIVFEPLVGRITNVRNFGDQYAIVLSAADDVPTDVIRHAYLHFLLDPLPLQYSHVTAVKRPLFEIAAKAPRLAPDLKDDFNSYFAECLVRAVELRLKHPAPGERDAALDVDDADGYLLARPIYQQLPVFEKSEPAMKFFFPDMVRAIDLQAELTREKSVQLAPERVSASADTPATEAVARRKPTTVPNDPQAIAALTEGEKHIAEKNPRAAEASFRSVLAKYPDQPRAWYGLGLVALLDHDGERAKQVFGRLTTGEHAAMQDPLVLTWSHVYLARVLEDEGQVSQAKTEFEAALAVNGGPEQAKQAARKGLQDSEASKPSIR